MSEWQKVRLGNLGEVVTGKTPSKNNPEDWGDVMPFVTPSDYKSYGFVGVVPKPYSTDQMAELLNKVLGEKDCEWKKGVFFGKIERALDLIERGNRMRFIREADFVAALA